VLVDCPSEEDLASFASGQNDDAVARHVATCAACAEAVEIVRTSDHPDHEPPAAIDHGSPKDPEPGETIGRYVILRKLGRGGMGVVVLAYDPVLDRMLALKLLRVDRESPEVSARLAREAQSLARIAHPNVVRVFDAGISAGRLFLAMEYVEGETLRGWLAASPRSTKEILRVFIEVARGLQVTHEAGFVHRDIKPDNILVGTDEVARVADFGLVGWDRVSHPAPAPDDGSAGSGPALTQAHGRLGTPGYMAPEQLDGGDVGPAADQFALCASLWEALYGALPAADTDALDHTEPRPERQVPTWIRDVVRRGLRPSPEQRWPSIAALSDALGRDPVAARRRLMWRVVIGAILLGLAGLAAHGMWRRPLVQDTRCQVMDERLAGVWDAGRAEAVRARFVASKRPHAADTFARVERLLSEYARDWVSARVETCEATHVRGEQSESLLDLRMACLDRRLGELGALVVAFSTGDDPDVVDSAVQAVTRLSPVRACADTDALRAIEPMPDDPAARAEVEKLLAVLDGAGALERTGQYHEGLTIATSAAEQAERIGYAPALAAALARRGSLEEKSGDARAAAATFERALLIAADARDDALAARLWVDLLNVLARALARPEDAVRLRPGAEAAVRRAGSTPELEADLWTSLGIAHYSLGNYDEGRRYQSEALALLEDSFGPEHPSVARSLTSLGIMAFAQGAHAEAQQHHERALAIFEHAFGPEHPHVAASLTNLGLVSYAQGAYADASHQHGRALELWERSLGSGHPHVAAGLTNLGLALLAQGKHADARRAHRRALAVREQIFGSEHPEVAGSLSNLGSVFQAQGDHEAARVHHERALALREQALGPEHPDVAISLNNLGDALLEQGSYADAHASYERALAIWERALPAEHPHLAYPLTGLARSRLQLGRAEEARGVAERALALREAAGVSAAELASSRFVLARVLWAMGPGSGRERALALARQAAAGFQEAGSVARAQRAEVETWLRARLR
jgi:eukaryotic-like serine/threonine-protein kinase